MKRRLGLGDRGVIVGCAHNFLPSGEGPRGVQKCGKGTQKHFLSLQAEERGKETALVTEQKPPWLGGGHEAYPFP